MTIHNLKLSEIINMIPDFHVSKKVVECPWEIKGKVMRSLIEEKQNENIELFEGVKVYKDGGWVLVLPDAEQPLCRVIGEGVSQEIANELTDIYVEKIKGLRDK
jgi:mannose-1-phosphate guanylyltransferase/phosphomannomutase